MELPRLKIGMRDVQEMISGHNGQLPLPDPIECLKQAEGPEWKLDSCRFLLSLALSGDHQGREQAYLTECAAMTLPSVFDVLLHEIVHYYGLDIDIRPKKVRWNDFFLKQLATRDNGLVSLLDNERKQTWFRKAMGLRNFVIHHAGLLQNVNINIGVGDDRRTYTIVGDDFFDQDESVERPDSLRDGYIDRERLLAEVIAYMERMCGVVDRVRLYCFDHAPAFHWGRVRRQARLPS